MATCSGGAHPAIVYIPGPTDPRFRRLQGQGHKDHFRSLEEQLDARSNQDWFLGGDFNNITNTNQPHWEGRGLADVHTPPIILPARASDDLRNVSTHGRRLLGVLSDRGIIMNGIESHSFSGAFTRLPQRDADCPEVLDYICGPPSALRLLWEASLQVLDIPPDFSDHLPTVVEVIHDEAIPGANDAGTHFRQEQLHALKVPENKTLIEISEEIRRAPEYDEICSSLSDHLGKVNTMQKEPQYVVDANLEGLTRLIFESFQSRRLVKKRSFDKQSKSLNNARAAATPELRSLRHAARQARKVFLTLVNGSGDAVSVATAKKNWNCLSHRCRTLSARVRQGFHADWRSVWKRMQQSAPRQLWSTFWKFTKQVAVEPTSTPDQQWEHWVTQADVVESVWTTKESENAEAWTNDLRCSCSDAQLPPP